MIPGWWPEQSLLVLRLEEEWGALIEEGESPGIVRTLLKARKLAGLRPEEKLYLARVKAEFNGQMGRVRPVRSGDGLLNLFQMVKGFSTPPRLPNIWGWQRVQFGGGPPKDGSQK